jgi:hypothetical protein
VKGTGCLPSEVLADAADVRAQQIGSHCSMSFCPSFPSLVIPVANLKSPMAIFAFISRIFNLLLLVAS